MALWIAGSSSALAAGFGSAVQKQARISMSPCVRFSAGGNGAFRASEDDADHGAKPNSASSSSGGSSGKSNGGKPSGFEASRIVEQAKDTSLSSLEGNGTPTPYGFGQYTHDKVEREEDESRVSCEGGSDNRVKEDKVDEQWKNVFPSYIRNGDGTSACEDGNVDGKVSAKAAAAAAASVKELESHVSPFSLANLAPSLSVPPCSSAQPPKQGGKNLSELITHDPIWAAIRAEARLEAEREPLLSSFLYASILAHPCFERSMGFVLANRLKNATLLATQLLDVFDDVFMHEAEVQDAIRLDVQAVKDRDPSCRSYSSALLYLKGYHALQSYRVAHALWNRGQRVLALALQSRISEVFAVDIHPAARIGKAVMLDHGTGVVIGETCIIGDRVSLMQGVTLGGTGKEAGDRHPKIEEGVLIGAGATVLGNIKIGRCAMVAAGSLVLKDVPPHSMAAGTPAKVVGTLEEPTPALTMKHDAMRCQISDESLCEGAGI